MNQEAEPRGTLALGGSVVGPDGLAVAGAHVLIDSAPARTATTDERGSFSFDGLIPRSYVVRARSQDSCGIAGVRLTREGQLVIVHLQPGVTVTVGVVDSFLATPVANAQVDAGELSATTSEQGGAVLRPLSPGWADIRISAEGYASLSISTLISDAPLNHVEAQLERAHTVGGVVLDEHGAPVPCATIFVLGDFAIPLAGDRPAAVTDEQGRFRATDVAAGVRKIFAIDAHHAPATSGPLVVDRDRLDVVLAARRGGRLEGRVVDPNGAPAADAAVHVAAHDGWYSRQVVSGADGTFTVEGLGRSHFRVRAESALGASATEVVDLSSVESNSIELSLLRSGAIAGSVVDDQGSPCADEAVHAIFCANDSVFSSETTDADGRFMIEGVPEGEHLVWAGRFSDQDFGRDEVTARTGDNRVFLKKSTFGSVRGEVALEDATDPPEEMLATIFGTTVGVHRTYQATGTGVFQMDGLPPDTYQLMVTGSEFIDTRLEIEVVANRATELRTLVVHRGRSASGQVVDATGAPVSAARLRVGEVRRRVATFRLDRWDIVTGPDGRFSIAGLRATSEYLIVATHDRGCSRGVAIPTSSVAPPLTVVLLPCGSLVGIVVDGGRQVPDVYVVIGDPETQFAITDENGAFAFARVPTGTNAIRVMRSGTLAPVYEGEVEVRAGRPAEVTLDIQVAEA